MLFSKKYYLVLLLLTTLVINTNSSFAAGQPYSDANENFSVEFPSTWQTKSQYLGTAVMALSPQLDPADSFPENLNVVTEKLTMPMNAQQYYEANLVSMKQMLKDFSILEASPVTVGGSPAIKMTATHVMGNFNAKVIAVFLTHNDKGYVITCTATPSTFEQYKGEFEAIISSFKFLK